jgi:hypothetical protein
MGATGTGKTTLIRSVTGYGDPGEDMSPSSETIFVRRAMLKEKVISLVDTPGFDSCDEDGFKQVSEWVSKEYRNNNTMINGIIYLHRISDNRMPRSEVRNLEKFRAFVGDDYLPNVIMATTMWDDVKSDLGTRRQNELRDGFWKQLLHRKAKLWALTPSNRVEIFLHLMDCVAKPLSIQREMFGPGDVKYEETTVATH